MYSQLSESVSSLPNLTNLGEPYLFSSQSCRPMTDQWPETHSCCSVLEGDGEVATRPFVVGVSLGWRREILQHEDLSRLSKYRPQLVGYIRVRFMWAHLPF